jgi:ABC-type branched-subunit amino acid transport system ATPase component
VILEVRDVVRRFGGVRAVDGASLSVEAGSITSLIGPNGAGKSTLFHVVSGFLSAEQGEVAFEGKRIDRRPPHRIARAGLVRTFQHARVLRRMSVLDNLLLARPDDERARELLALVRLDAHTSDYAGTLSGGEQKLLDFARALMTEPRLLLLDEPMAGVSPTLRVQLLEHIHELRDRTGVTFLIVEHDLEVVMRASDRVIVMNEGRVIASGTPDEVRADPRVVDAYLGRHA